MQLTRTFALLSLLLPGAALAQSSFTYQSDSGDWIGQGQSGSFQTPDSVITAQRNNDNGVSFRIETPEGDYWRVELAAAEKATIEPGFYPEAERLPFRSPTKPGLSVTTTGRGCNNLSGLFRVYNAEYADDGTVQAFAADLIQHCENGDEALVAAIRFESDYPVDLASFANNPKPAGNVVVMYSDNGDYIGQGKRYHFDDTTGQFQPSMNHDNGINVRYQGSDSWNFDFAAPEAAPLANGEYLGATRFPFQTAQEAGLSISGAGRGCNKLTGRFRVLEIKLNDAGEPQRFAADFVQHCEGQTPALYGAIRINSYEPVEIVEPASFDRDSSRALNLPSVRLLDGSGQQYRVGLAWLGRDNGFMVRWTRAAEATDEGFVYTPTFDPSDGTLRIPALDIKNILGDTFRYDATLKTDAGSLSRGNRFSITGSEKIQ